MAINKFNCIRADFLLSPIFLVSLVMLLVNDFILKPEFPSFLSGILSDFAGIIFFPLLLVGVLEVALGLFSKKIWATPSWFWMATALVAVVFIVTKFTDPGQMAYAWLVGPFQNLLPVVSQLGGSTPVGDPWDLLALLLSPIPVMVGYHYRPKR